MDLPASDDILAQGYRGFPLAKNRETYYPKMYTTQIYDLVNEQVREFSFSNAQDEVYMARDMIPALEKNSLSIYDRLYCGYETMRAHDKHGSYFLIRSRINDNGEQGRGVYGQVAEFVRSKKKETPITWRPLPGFRRKSPDIELRAIKIKHPKTKRIYVYLTNLPHNFGGKAIGQLYRRRWEIETSFKDLTCTLKMGQWHSKMFNGIMQEIFALLWLVNSTKRQMQQAVKRKDLIESNYERTNFKLSIRCIMDNLKLLFIGKLKLFYEKIGIWMNRMIETRRRDSRSYERVVKHRGREYQQANTVRRRPKPLTERHWRGDDCPHWRIHRFSHHAS